MHVINFSPVRKQQYHDGCHCYDGFKPKPIRFVLDKDEQLIYCDHCGNVLNPYVAFEIMVENWKQLEELEAATKRRIKRAWDIGRHYRPHKRVIKDLEKNIGRQGENKPCCPRCGEKFGLEEITCFINVKTGTISHVGEIGRFDHCEADWSKK